MRHVGALRGMGVHHALIFSRILHPLDMLLVLYDLLSHREQVVAWASPWYPVVCSFHIPKRVGSLPKRG